MYRSKTCYQVHPLTADTLTFTRSVVLAEREEKPVNHKITQRAVSRAAEPLPDLVRYEKEGPG